MLENGTRKIGRAGGHASGASWRLILAALLITLSAYPELARAQSPELAMRDLSSGQIKKGSRPIGFGGDGATWGNYALVWKDADTALLDYSVTQYSNGNGYGGSSAPPPPSLRNSFLHASDFATPGALN